MKNLISIIMSVYNAESSVEDSINSILNQTYENFEFLILDDYSTDKTKEILDNYKSKDKRIKIIYNNQNIGLTKSLNRLINMTNAKLIARQDADDVSLPNRLNAQLNYINKYNLDACTSRAYIKSSKRKVPKFSYLLPDNLVIRYKNPYIHGSLIIKKEVLNKLGNYDENFYYAQDYKLFDSLLQNKYKIKTLKQPLYILNMEDNISLKFRKEQNYYAECVRNNLQP
jgi:glycosyltransferase EpsE